MVNERELSWQEQLLQAKERILETSKKKKEEEKLKSEKAKQALREELKTETVDKLDRDFRRIEKECKDSARKLYPPAPLDAASAKLRAFREEVQHLKESLDRFPDVFSDSYKRVVPQMFKVVAELQADVERRSSQWEDVKAVCDGTSFRPRADGDDAKLVEIAKKFNLKAFGMEIAIPKNTFSGKRNNFYVAELDSKPYGYVEFLGEDNAISFALVPPEELNFVKIVKGFVYKACQDVRPEKKLSRANVRVTIQKEVKFYTDLGFIRSQTKDSYTRIYQRKVE